MRRYHGHHEVPTYAGRRIPQLSPPLEQWEIEWICREIPARSARNDALRVHQYEYSATYRDRRSGRFGARHDGV